MATDLDLMKIWFPAMAGMWSSLSVCEVIWGEESSVVHFREYKWDQLGKYWQLLRVHQLLVLK